MTSTPLRKSDMAAVRRPGRCDTAAAGPARSTPVMDVPAAMAVQTRHPYPGGDGRLVDERFEVASRCTDAALRDEDAARVSAMRRIAAARLAYCGLESLTDDAVLIVSELLTNDLLNSGTTHVSVKLTVKGRILHIAVEDGVPAGIKHPPASEQAEAGRGLHLVATLAHERGGASGFSDAGSTAWCTLVAVPKGEAVSSPCPTPCRRIPPASRVPSPKRWAPHPPPVRLDHRLPPGPGALLAGPDGIPDDAVPPGGLLQDLAEHHHSAPPAASDAVDRLTPGTLPPRLRIDRRCRRRDLLTVRPSRSAERRL